MKLVERIKNWWNKGGDALVAMVSTESYNSILDHPKINFDADELKRIETSFRHYRGIYDKVHYLNTMQQERIRSYFFINMTKSVSKYLKTLTFNERCEIHIGVADEETGEYPKSVESEFAREILDRTKFKKKLSDYLEPMFATGGIVVKPYYDSEAKKIDFSWCLADAFIPLRSNTNDISEGVIPTVTKKIEERKEIHYTLLEFHEWEGDLYIISNELYRSEQSHQMGKRVPLTSLDAYKNLEPLTVIPNLSRPLFTYLKPAGFNNLSPRSPLGLGVLDNSRSTVAAINDTYDQFHWEVKDGEQKSIISDHFTKTRMDANGRPIQYFDKDTSAFIALPGEIDNMLHKDITRQIRTTEYKEALNEFKSTLEMEVGLSPNTFTITDSGGVKTATEVISEDSETFKTRNEHVSELSDGIKDLIISTFELAKEVKVNGKPLYSGRIPERDEIGIDFDDGVFVSRESELEFYSKAGLNNLIPQQESIERLFNLPPAKAKEWVSRIAEDRLRSAPDMAQANAESTLLGQSELGD